MSATYVSARPSPSPSPSMIIPPSPPTSSPSWTSSSSESTTTSTSTTTTSSSSIIPPTTTTTTTPPVIIEPTYQPPPPPPPQPPQPETTTTTSTRTTNPPVTSPSSSLVPSRPTTVALPTTNNILNPSPTQVGNQDTGGSFPTAAIIGIAAAAVIIIGLISTVMVMKHRKRVRMQKELNPNELFGTFHDPSSPSPLAHPTSAHHNNKHHQNLNDDLYPEPEMQHLYHNSDYHHQDHNGHHDGGNYDYGHHGGDQNDYDYGGDGQDGGANQAQSNFDPNSGGGQAQSNVYNDPSGGGHQAIGNDGAVGNQYAPNGGGGAGDFQGVGQGMGDTGGNYDYGVGQGQNVGGFDQGNHDFYDGYGDGQETGYGQGGNDFGGYGQGQVDPSSGYGGNGVGGDGNNIGISGTGTGGGVGSPPLSPQGGGSGWGAPFSFGAVPPPPVPLISNRNSSNRVSVSPANTNAQLDTSSISHRPLDRFSSDASRSTHYSGSGAGSMSPHSPPIPLRPGASSITHSSWDGSTPHDRPLSQTSMTSSTTAGPYGQQYQSFGSPIMYPDFVPPPTSTKTPSPMIASVLPATTFSSNSGVRRSVGAPQDRGPDIASASGGQVSDLNAFERRAPQTQQENVENPDSSYNVVASTLRQPQGGV